MIVKSVETDQHVVDLEDAFAELEQNQMELNLNKCTFNGTFEKVSRVHGDTARDWGEPKEDSSIAKNEAPKGEERCAAANKMHGHS